MANEVATEMDTHYDVLAQVLAKVKNARTDLMQQSPPLDAKPASPPGAKDPASSVVQMCKAAVAHYGPTSFREHSLALDVPIHWLELDSHENFPCVLPTDLLQKMSQIDCVPKLVGDAEPSAIKDILLTYWRRFAKEFPSHQVLQRAGADAIPLCRTFPCYIHGDEGRALKRSGVMILSLQGAIGKGSRPFQVRHKLKTIKSLKQGLNVGGNSFNSRLLFAAMPRRYYAQKPSVYRSLVRTLVQTLRTLQDRGFSWRNEQWRVVTVGLKGDLPFLTKTARLERHYLRAARKDENRSKAVGVCAHCMAGTENVPAEDFNENAAWRSVPCSVPWKAEAPPEFLELYHVPDRPEAFVKTDVWHNFHGGAGKDFVASALVECLVLVESEASSFPRRVEAWSKHDDTRQYLAFLEWFLKENEDAVQNNSILVKIQVATEAINRAFSTLYSSGLWLTRTEAEVAGRNGRIWLEQYALLANEAYEAGYITHTVPGCRE
ncbi:unnamed protein product [Effrenium voratum]|nr:unnamed protein product [Effrenium voratum]